MHQKRKLFLILILFILVAGVISTGLFYQQIAAPDELEVFIGAAMRIPAEEIIQNFQEKYGVKVNAHYGGSGALLSQMELANRGDIYMSGSADFMEKAKLKKIVLPQTEKRVLYLIPAICVQKGNPKHISDISDLAKPDIRVGIGHIESVCLGPIAIEVFEYNHLIDKIKPNIVTMAESCEKTANLISLKKVDAVIGWRDFQNWNPKGIQAIMLKPEQIPRISYAPIAIGKFCRNKNLARKFLNFFVSKESNFIFKKWGYILSEKEAKKFAPNAIIGGSYKIPAGW